MANAWVYVIIVIWNGHEYCAQFYRMALWSEDDDDKEKKRFLGEKSESWVISWTLCKNISKRARRRRKKQKLNSLRRSVATTNSIKSHSRHSSMSFGSHLLAWSCHPFHSNWCLMSALVPCLMSNVIAIRNCLSFVCDNKLFAVK